MNDGHPTATSFASARFKQPHHSSINTTMKLHRILALIALILTGATSESPAQATKPTGPLGNFLFPFPPGEALVGKVEPNGETWQAAGPAGTPIKIVQGSLSVPGLAAATGNRVRLVSGNAAASITLPGPVSSKTIFLSCALNVANLGSSGQDGVSVGFWWWNDYSIRLALDGYELGVSESGAPPTVWFKQEQGTAFNLNETLFLVASVESRDIGDNAVLHFWINPAPPTFGAASAPAPTHDVADGTTEDVAALTSQLFLRLNAAAGSGVVLDVDEIRVGITWASVTPPASALIGWSPGSNGSYGPLNVTADTTLPLPPDGIIHATSINVAAGKTLRFQKNANNTPVLLLATGRVQIDGTIDVSGGPGTTTSAGLAGPSGWDGGMPITGTFPAGDGFGPGGGRYTGGRGAPAAHQFPNNPNLPPGGATYGGPLGVEGGSGGSGVGYGGGGGGGSIIIAAGGEITVGPQGAVIAKGGNAGDGGANAGSGGRIRLIAPRVLGTGALLVPGGDAYRGPDMGGWGWVRVDRLDRSPLTLNVPVPGYFTSPLSIGAVMKVMPDPAPRLRIKSVDGVAVAADSGPVTLIRSQDAPSSVNVVVEAGNFGALVPAQLYIVPDNAPRSVLKATIDNRAPGGNPVEHTFAATVPPNMRATLQVFAGKSLPADP